ncbi:sarcosine oxidase subunit gamma [Pseudooceanicola sp. HF7]|uniref:sarcosine oxidase subunit gamma n=1 Tax=Pseudooceanicola sp. HF7 TaxID=2721560 RepID=UPI001430C671|nr:sarcosine oxidase subunit gamma family protein [Pseudooceanicola sp. HF7]NIZ10656.1 sarcosine oxidase subunit gamma [Pseudooceanicola sp. HF7]
MSDVTGPAPVSALNGAVFDGYVRIAEAPMRGMITLRGDLSSSMMRNGATKVTGCDMPGQRQISLGEDRVIAWMSPDELLVGMPLSETAEALETLAGTFTDPAFSAVDVTHARAAFTLTGEDALVREVLAKLAPVDMSPEAFPEGSFRRTRLAQVPAAFWMPEPGRAELVCFRSVAGYVFSILSDAAREDGIVGLYA